MDKPIEAYLESLKSHTKVLGERHTRFILKSDANKFYICACKKDNPELISGNIEKWWYEFEANVYLVYPYGTDKIAFS